MLVVVGVVVLVLVLVLVLVVAVVVVAKHFRRQTNEGNRTTTTRPPRFVCNRLGAQPPYSRTTEGHRPPPQPLALQVGVRSAGRGHETSTTEHMCTTSTRNTQGPTRTPPTGTLKKNQDMICRLAICPSACKNTALTQHLYT